MTCFRKAFLPHSQPGCSALPTAALCQLTEARGATRYTSHPAEIRAARPPASSPPSALTLATHHTERLG